MNNKYNADKEWEKAFENTSIAYPSEYVIRILKGSYPKLELDKNSFKNKLFLDMGCGDGRNLVLAHSLGFKILGVEISQRLVDIVKKNLLNEGIKHFDIRVGKNNQIPFNNNEIDYLLSWNSSYYMGKTELDYKENVKEFARILKSDGQLILSIPKASSFIYKDSEEIKKGYRLIKNDPFNVRNGEILRMFSSQEEIENTFSEWFKDFRFASIHDDCFGLDYHWHLAVCIKK